MIFRKRDIDRAHTHTMKHSTDTFKAASRVKGRDSPLNIDFSMNTKLQLEEKMRDICERKRNPDISFINFFDKIGRNLREGRLLEARGSTKFHQAKKCTPWKRFLASFYRVCRKSVVTRTFTSSAVE